VKNIIGRIPEGLRDRPFDVYTALILFIVGVYGMVDDNFPERFGDELTIFLVTIISGYLMVSSSIILVALLKDKKKAPALHLFGQLFGWAFVAAAALATSLLYAIHPILSGFPDKMGIWSIWMIIWFTMFVAAMLRVMELYNIYKGCKK
jgi:hypothetical protein